MKCLCKTSIMLEAVSFHSLRKYHRTQCNYEFKQLARQTRKCRTISDYDRRVIPRWHWKTIATWRKSSRIASRVLNLVFDSKIVDKVETRWQLEPDRLIHDALCADPRCQLDLWISGLAIDVSSIEHRVIYSYK